MYSNLKAHTHSEEYKLRGIQPDARLFIDQLFETNNYIKPRKILKRLDRERIKLPSFGSDYKREMFWAHMRRTIDKKIKMINDVSIETEVMEDIEKIQISQNPKIFEKASQLFLNKWQATKYKKCRI